MVKVGDVMRACRNYFPVSFTHGAWTIADGKLSPDGKVQPGDWIAISGSMRNDGVYLLNEDGSIPEAVDESFTGSVWLLAPSRAFLDLCKEIADYGQVHPASPVTSEQFGQYSVTHTLGGWEAAFGKKLTAFRRMYSEVLV